VVFVLGVDHEKREVYTSGGKATLNAPLLDIIFRDNLSVDRIEHYHDQESELPVLPWAPPGTVRDSLRVPNDLHGQNDDGSWKGTSWTSFNIKNHGCYLLYDKEGNQL